MLCIDTIYGAMPPPPPPALGRQDCIIRIELYAKVRHGPPFELGHTNGQNLGEDFYFGPKTGLNFSEGFFFWSSPNFGQENGLLPSG